MHKAALTFRRPLAALLTLAVALAAAIAFSLSSSAPTTADAAATVTINIKNYKYSKATVTVKKGTTIKWVNQDTMKHDVNGSKKPGGPKSKLLAKGKSYTWKATKAGTFAYYCSPHPYMKAKVIVK